MFCSRNVLIYSIEVFPLGFFFFMFVMFVMFIMSLFIRIVSQAYRITLHNSNQRLII